MKRLFSAGGMVERDALIAYLRGLEIEAISPDRDVSRKVTENTIDLSLGGYSAVAGGFAVFVADEDFDRAEAGLATFLREARAREASGQAIDYWQKYYSCALFSLTVPAIMSAFATYHLIQAIRVQGRPKNWWYFGLATACYVAGWAIVVVFTLSKLGLT